MTSAVVRMIIFKFDKTACLNKQIVTNNGVDTDETIVHAYDVVCDVMCDDIVCDVVPNCV